MRVLNVYGKDDLNLITYNGKLITDMMDKFFLNFPLSYRENYDRNLETLELYKVDEMACEFDSAEYIPSSNVLVFKSNASLPHEFLHMASSDCINGQFAFCRDGIYSLYENGLIEGMTEYLSCLAKDGIPDAYFFEYFVIAMLSSVEGIFEPFFIPSYDKFISLFPNKRDIYSLMYALDFYHNEIAKINDNTSGVQIKRIGVAVKNTINSLIDIELSFNKGINERKAYGDKFMDLISNDDLKSLVEDVCHNYRNYAFREIKKRVLRRM